MTAHALARLIPDSNVLSIPSVRSLLDPGLKSRALETAYSPAGGFGGAFSVNEDHAPPWAVRTAKYNRDEFHHDTPARYKLLSDLPEDILPRSADLGVRCINYSHALKLDGEAAGTEALYRARSRSPNWNHSSSA